MYSKVKKQVQLKVPYIFTKANIKNHYKVNQLHKSVSGLPLYAISIKQIAVCSQGQLREIYFIENAISSEQTNYWQEPFYSV